MSIRDVVQLVSVAMDQLRRIRPHLSDEQRQRQAESIRNLGTSQAIYRTNEKPDMNDQRGFILEELVKADPEYPGRQMSSDERAVADYFLAFLRAHTPFFPDYPELAFHNADDILIRIESKTKSKFKIAKVVGLVEIKHSGSAQEIRAQLKRIERDLEFVVALMNRNITILQSRVGKKPNLPSVEGVEWPQAVTTIQIEPNYEKRLYLPDKGEPGRVDGWQKYNSVFDKNEIREIAMYYWEQFVEVEFVEKGGTTAGPSTTEGTSVIHRSPHAAEDVRRSALDVREHGEEYNEMVQPQAQSVERREGGLTYYYVNNVAADLPTMQEDLDRRMALTLREASRVLADVKHRIPQWDGQAELAKVHDALRSVTLNLLHIPAKGLIARYELDEARTRIQLSGTRAVLEAVKSDPKGKQHAKLSAYERILTERERKLEGAEEETESYEARPDEEGITHNGSLFQAVVVMFDEVFGDVARQRNIEKLKDLGVPVDTVDEVVHGAAAAVPASPNVAAAGSTDKVPCPNCGALNRADRKFCNECNKPLTQPEVAPSGPRTCGNCGTPADPEDKSCGNCGSPLPPPTEAPSPGAIAAADEITPNPQPQPSSTPAAQPAPQEDRKKFCTECGSANVAAAKFCGECGHPLSTQ